jgi:hypothetical protein
LIATVKISIVHASGLQFKVLAKNKHYNWRQHQNNVFRNDSTINLLFNWPKKQVIFFNLGILTQKDKKP